MADARKLKDRAAELAARGKLEKAAELYREALKADHKDVATQQKLAEVLRRAGRTGEAIDAYRVVAERFARDGLLIKAIAISKTILELDPDHVETQAALADLYAKRAADQATRPPARTVVMPAVRGVASAPPAIVLPPPAPEEAGVSIPLARVAPAPAEGSVPSVDPFAPIDLPEAASVPLEVLVERGHRTGPPPRRAQTDFTRIVFAAEAAARAGVEGEVLAAEEVLQVEEGATVEELLEVEVQGDEPLGPASTPAPALSTPAPVAALTPPPAARPAAPPAQRPPAALPQRPPPPPAPAPPPTAGLPRVPIFSDLSRDAFVALTSAMLLTRVNEGEVVIREGDAGTSFYVIATGKLAVSKRDERGEAVVLARLGEGDFFGEMALLSGAPRAATVIAEDPCELLEFRPEALLAIAGKHPHLASSLKRFYRQRLLANAMAVSPVFRPFAKGDRKLVMERFRAREVSEGETVVREGEPSDGLYVVLDGTVDVVKRREGADVLVSRLREGDLFGEMSCLRKAPASASVVVRRGGTLLRLPRKDFDELVSTYPQILELVAELSEERAENLDAIVSGRAEWTEDGLVLV